MNNANNFFGQKKRVHTPTFEESEMLAFGLPRKKFISEDSFANDMAAMTINEQPNPSFCLFLPSKKEDKNIVRIDNLDEYLTDEEDTGAYMDMYDGQSIIDYNGLPLELRPGENRPKIPSFVISNLSSIDPRDRFALQDMMKSHNSQSNNTTAIEVIHNPATIHHDTSTSMDID